MAIMKAVVDALNSIRSNVWAVALICVGVALILKGHPQEGGSLLTGAFAVFRASKDDESATTLPLNTSQPAIWQTPTPPSK